MPSCNTGRNIQKYKGAAASTLQDVTDNGNTTTGDIITTSGFFIGDGSKITGISGIGTAFTLQETSDSGNTTSNTIQFTNTITSFTTSGNVLISGNVTASNFYGDGSELTSVALKSDLTSNVGRISTLETKTTDISYIDGTTSISGNLTVLGNTTTIDTVNLIVQDPILQLSNASASVDSGMLIARPIDTDNVFVGFHQSLSEFAIGFTDSHAGLSEIVIKDGEDFTLNVHGNVEASYYFGDGTQLIGVALKSDLTSNASRVGVLETDLTSNASRVGVLETDLTSNASRVGVLETDLTSNASRVGVLETDLASNSTSITNLQNSTIISNSSGITNAFETGDLIYASSQNTLSNLSIGSTNEVLTVSGTGIPVWATASGGGGGGYWTQHINGNDIYYNSGNVGIANTAPTNTLSVGTVVSIQETASGDVLIVKGGGYFNDDVYIAKRLTVPVGGEIKADTIKVRSLSQKGTLVVAERLVDTISLG